MIAMRSGGQRHKLCQAALLAGAKLGASKSNSRHARAPVTAFPALNGLLPLCATNFASYDKCSVCLHDEAAAECSAFTSVWLLLGCCCQFSFAACTRSSQQWLRTLKAFVASAKVMPVTTTSRSRCRVCRRQKSSVDLRQRTLLAADGVMNLK